MVTWKSHLFLSRNCRQRSCSEHRAEILNPKPLTHLINIVVFDARFEFRSAPSGSVCYSFLGKNTSMFLGLDLNKKKLNPNRQILYIPIEPLYYNNGTHDFGTSLKPTPIHHRLRRLLVSHCPSGSQVVSG